MTRPIGMHWAGAAAGDFIAWDQAQTDATPGFLQSPERAGEALIVALNSVVQSIWKSDPPLTL